MANEQLDRLVQDQQATGEKKLKFELTVNELNVILSCLQEAAIPHRISDPVLRSVWSQAQAQQNN